MDIPRPKIEVGDIVEIVTTNTGCRFSYPGNLAVVVQVLTIPPRCQGDFKPYLGHAVDCYGDIVPTPQAPVAMGSTGAPSSPAGVWWIGTNTGQHPHGGVPYTYRLARKASTQLEN